MDMARAVQARWTESTDPPASGEGYICLAPLVFLGERLTDICKTMDDTCWGRCLGAFNDALDTRETVVQRQCISKRAAVK